MGTGNVSVRRLGSADLNLVLACVELFPEPPTVEWVEDFFSRGGNQLFCAFVDDGPVGMLVATESPCLGNPPDLVVTTLSVASDHRGHGVAESLLDRVAAVAEDAGLARLRLSIPEAQSDAAGINEAPVLPWRHEGRTSLVFDLG